MNWIYKLAAWILSKDAVGTVHTITNGRVIYGWIYGRHGWHMNMPNQYQKYSATGYTGPAGRTGPEGSHL